MNFTQITLAITILAIFGTLAATSIFLTSMKKIQKDWPTYRCNPAIMPFAGVLGHDVMSNFTQCIGQAQQGMMGYYTAGSNYAGKLGGDVMGGMTSTVNDFRKVQASMGSGISGITGDIFGVFNNVMIQFQRLIIDTRDLLKKTMGAMTAIVYTLMTTVHLGESIVAGPFMGVINTLGCFHPGTPIRLESGEVVKMVNVDLGTILENGSTVVAVMRIRGNPKNPYYKIHSKTLGVDIFVTADHKIRDPDSGRFIAVKDCKHATVTEQCGNTLSCLVTDDHLIPVGEFTFWDWED